MCTYVCAHVRTHMTRLVNTCFFPCTMLASGVAFVLRCLSVSRKTHTEENFVHSGHGAQLTLTSPRKKNDEKSSQRSRCLRRLWKAEQEVAWRRTGEQPVRGRRDNMVKSWPWETAPCVWGTLAQTPKAERDEEGASEGRFYRALLARFINLDMNQRTWVNHWKILGRGVTPSNQCLM